MPVSFNSAETAGDWEDIASDAVYYTLLLPSLPTFSTADWLTGGVREGGWPRGGVQVYGVRKGSINKAGE